MKDFVNLILHSITICISILMMSITLVSDKEKLAETTLLGHLFEFSFIAFVPLIVLWVCVIGRGIIYWRRVAENKISFTLSLILPLVALTLFDNWIFKVVF